MASRPVHEDDSEWVQVLAAWRAVTPQLYRLAAAIKRYEGWKPGSRSWRNRNPGNLRSSPYEVMKVDGFSSFSSDHQGMVALMWDLYAKCNGRTSTRLGPKSTLEDLFAIYAPSGDDNNPDEYAEAVAGELGISVLTKLEKFLEVV